MIEPDILLALGTVIGLAVKAAGLADPRTRWSRKSSLLNVTFYPFTALLPFYMLELWYTFTTSVLSFLVWLGIYIYRAPEEENLLGTTGDIRE